MKDKRIISIFIVLGVIFTILGATLAYWSWSSTNAQKTNVTFTVGANFSCSADGGGNITNTNYFVPTDCTNSTYAIKREITTMDMIDNRIAWVVLNLLLKMNLIPVIRLLEGSEFEEKAKKVRDMINELQDDLLKAQGVRVNRESINDKSERM